MISDTLCELGWDLDHYLSDSTFRDMYTGPLRDRILRLKDEAESIRMILESRQRQAEDFDSKTFDNDVVELKHSFETAMETEINRVAKQWKIPRVAAKDLVDQDISVRGQATVLPIYHRVYSRFLAQYPNQLAAAEAGE